MEDDNLRNFDQVYYRSVNVKNAIVWLDQNCNASQVSNFLQKVSDTTNSKRLHSPWAFWILGTFFKWTGNINIIFIKFEYLTYHFLTKDRDRIDSIDTLFQYRMLVLSALCIQLELDEPFFNFFCFNILIMFM